MIDLNLFLDKTKFNFIFALKLIFVKLKIQLFFLIITCVMPVFIQNNSITGTISSNSESVPFVNIYISKTKIGTTSDENGFYE